jgi:hypothetical protein
MFRGSVTLNGAIFFIDADSSQAAVEKARQGEFEDYDIDGAELVDWEIRPGTCERAD